MFNVGITCMPWGASVYPERICVGIRQHSAAVFHYVNALRARILPPWSTGGGVNRVVLESYYGFRLRIDAVRDMRTNSMSLSLPPTVDRMFVARAIMGRPGIVQITYVQSCLIVTDPFSITWSIS